MLNALIRPHRRKLLLATMLAAGSGAASTALLAFINELAQAGIAGNSARPLYQGLLLLFALVGLSAAAQILLASLGAQVVAALRLDLAQRLLAIDFAQLMQRKHVVMNALVQDIGRLGPMTLLGPQLAYNIFLIVLGSAYLARLNVALFGVLVVFHGMVLVLGWAVERRLRHRFDAMRQADDDVFAVLRSLGDGKKELSLSAPRARHFTQVLLRPAIAKARETTEALHRSWGLADSVAGTLSYAAALVMVAVGNLLLMLPTAIIVQAVIAGIFLAGPIHFMIQVAPQVAQGYASLRHLQRLGLDLAQNTPASATAAVSSDPGPWQHLHARGLTYRYAAEVPGAAPRGAGPFDLDLRRGEMVFITGGNGSGKSTLLLLVCALLRPDAGTLQLDGRCVWQDPERFRRLIGTVFSDFFLFSHVLDAEGHALPDTRIDDLLQRVSVQADVVARDGMLSRLNLSTGQRKRLALVQCFAEDREILVLDEWAADQDPAFREHFYCRLLPALQRAGKTLLVVTHDDRYFHLADRVLALEDGRIRQSSTLSVSA